MSRQLIAAVTLAISPPIAGAVPHDASAAHQLVRKAVACDKGAAPIASVQKALRQISDKESDSSNVYRLREPISIGGVTVRAVAIVEEEGVASSYSFSVNVAEGPALAKALGLRQVGPGYTAALLGGTVNIMVGAKEADYTCLPRRT